jgi:hypothetical protein
MKSRLFVKIFVLLLIGLFFPPKLLPFEAENNKNNLTSDSMHIMESDGRYIIKYGNANLLAYQFKTVYPPGGIDTSYKRDGFIHPLWSLKGNLLTQIQPADHYHHYGIWNPWTHVLFESDTVDFWNLAKHQGTVRFVELISKKAFSEYAELKVLHDHVVFKRNASEKTALKEEQTIRVYKPGTNDSYVCDIVIDLRCASDSPVLLLKYRYGGFSWRSTKRWNSSNSEVYTSSNKTRENADGSLERWFVIQGEFDTDYSGIEFMSHPLNYNHPEPARIWPPEQNGRGDVFANFSPTKNKDWLLEPGKTYRLMYRLLIFDGKHSRNEAENAWQNFSRFSE